MNYRYMLFLSYCYKNFKTAKTCLKTKQIYATSFQVKVMNQSLPHKCCNSFMSVTMDSGSLLLNIHLGFAHQVACTSVFGKES